jgi:hyperosmotically inducible periplasmic protein
MKGRMARIAVMLGTLFTFNVAVAAESEAQAGFVKNSPITTKVKNQLESDRSLSGIEVETDKHGEVWLSGSVDSKDLADRAVSIAKDTQGVKAVHDYIEVAKTH